jgi:hypothetical protein
LLPTTLYLNAEPGSPTRATRISIAMALYNRDRFLAEQLGSLARQERIPDELLLEARK